MISSFIIFLYILRKYKYTKIGSIIKFSMVRKVLGLIVGYILMVIGFTYFWLYLNLFAFGFSIRDYFFYILGRYECYFFIIGFIIFVVSLCRKEKKQ